MLERIRSPTIDAKVTRGIWLGELFLAAIGHLLEKRTARRSRKFTSSVVPRRVTKVDSIRDVASRRIWTPRVGLGVTLHVVGHLLAYVGPVVAVWCPRQLATFLDHVRGERL